MSIQASTVTTLHNGKTKQVKNLGWFLSKSRYVRSLHFQRTPENPLQEGVLIVTLAIGSNAPTHEYRSGFACEQVLRDLLKRSQWLRGIPLTVA